MVLRVCCFLFLCSCLISCGKGLDVDKKSSNAPKTISVTTHTTDGTFNGATSASEGISFADTICNTDFPGFKAMIASSLRHPNVGGSGAVDWVLKPNTIYKNDAGAVIGTTTANAIFNFPLTNSFTTAGIDDHWSGFAADWTVNNAQNCLDWSSDVANGEKGVNTALDSTAIRVVGTNCMGIGVLVCVEQ